MASIRVPKAKDPICRWIEYRIAHALEVSCGVLVVGDLPKIMPRINSVRNIGSCGVQKIEAVVEAFMFNIAIKEHEPDGELDPGGDDRLVPTGHSPGSVGKIEVLRYRAENNLPLYHDEDEKNQFVVRRNFTKLP